VTQTFDSRWVGYHFLTGRLYMGQKIGTLMHQAQQQWWERGRAKDLFHSAISNTSPFSFILLHKECPNLQSQVTKMEANTRCLL